MASATDIITYIGVPLAVLGVAPIFYTFLSAFYTRVKVGRVLRRNSIVCPIRAKLMTGVVEIDLPVCHLDIPSRNEPAYWLPSTSSWTLDGASWSCYNFFLVITDRTTLRLQRSDKIVFPTAEIDFRLLLEYLLDRGYIPNQPGFHTLRMRRLQTSEGTIIMQFGNGQGLSFVKPGTRHGSIIMNFSRMSHFTPHLIHHRDSTKTLPPFHLTGPLLKGNDDSTTEKRRYFVMRWAGLVGLKISIHEKPAPSPGTDLPPNHILSQVHPHNSNLGDETPWGKPLDWFACAAIALYGFEMSKPFYVFSPDERFLHAAQWYSSKFSALVLHGLVLPGLVLPDLEDLNEFLSDIDSDQYDVASAHRSENSQQVSPTDRSNKDWVTKKDINSITEYTNSFYHGSERRMMQHLGKFAELGINTTILEKDIDISMILRMCIRYLCSRPIRFGSLSIGSLPQKPPSLDYVAQQTADQILRMTVLDAEFAEGVLAQLRKSLVNPLAGALEAEAAKVEAARVEAVEAKRKEPGEKKLGRKHRRLERAFEEMKHNGVEGMLLRGAHCNEKETGLFCCAMVLLAIVGQRADYLRSGDDIRQCVSDWPRVYLS